MNYMEAEELALLVLGISEEDADGIDFDELMYGKFEVSMEQFHTIAKALVPFTMAAPAGLSGKLFKGFVNDGYFVTKMAVETDAVPGGETA